MQKLILPILLLILLSGCAAPVKQQPTPTIREITPPLTTKSTSTTLPPSTRTPVSTLTPSLTPTITDTPLPTPTVDLVTMVMINQSPVLYASYPSPDGLYRMDVIIYDCVNTGGADENAYEQLILVDPASGEGQLADEQLLYCGGLGAYGFEGRYWSPNSRYFYYTTARQGTPDGCGYWAAPLSRYDTATSQNEFLGMGSLSPDGTRVATIDPVKQELVAWNVDDGELARFPAFTPNRQVGPIAWSPDSQSLVYLQVDSWCPLSGWSEVARVDLDTQQQVQVLGSQSPTFGDVRWETLDELSLVDENGAGWRYNLVSGELTQVP